MVVIHDVERKVPLKVLEHKIDNVSYQYVVEAASTIDNCLIAFEEIAEHMRKMRKEIEDQQAQENQNPIQE